MTPGPAAVLGGVAGLLVLGPLGAVAGAGAAAYAATRNDKGVSSGSGMVNTAGASGEVAAGAHSKVAEGVSGQHDIDAKK